ncbi:hypothetical protein ACL02U_11075 [Streptomyces sp. MS06]|uniref:hypothetical protein n=1 Tax=Streptomyces sp. MS06 TaxID=3385974 RepID=UPI0039A0B1F1
MTTPLEDTGTPLPDVQRPDRTDHPVLAAILIELRARDSEPTVVAHYEDAP